MECIPNARMRDDFVALDQRSRADYIGMNKDSQFT
jgi:hypothetical protein